MMTLTPAYGRDYKSRSAAEKDFRDGKDFIINQFGHPYDGKYASIRDFAGETVKLRFNNLKSVAVVEV